MNKAAGEGEVKRDIGAKVMISEVQITSNKEGKDIGEWVHVSMGQVGLYIL